MQSVLSRAHAVSVACRECYGRGMGAETAVSVVSLQWGITSARLVVLRVRRQHLWRLRGTEIGKSVSRGQKL